MIVRVVAWLVLLWPASAFAQGFAGMGADAEGYALPQRGMVFEFPTDHAAHLDFRIEWWYLTAVLTGEDGEDYGAQWTLFRTALAPGSGKGWRDPQIWFAHAAATALPCLPFAALYT